MTTSIYTQNKYHPVRTFSKFLENSYNTHGTKYDYSESIYTNNKNSIEIICPKHGVFKLIPSKHISGRICPRCKKNIIKENTSNRVSEFVNRSKQIHGITYDYSNTKFNGMLEYVNILCTINNHGEFIQRANAHISGQGCPKCGKYKRGWCVTKDTPSKDLSWYRYILKLSNETESFYKFGIANNINRRTKEISKTYDVEIIDLYYGSHLDCYKLEQKLKHSIKQKGRKYTPRIDFIGKTECFI